MSKHKVRRPRRAPVWFDRINRYRVAAGFLFVPFILALIGFTVGIDKNTIMPLHVRQVIYWIGLFLLTISLAMDAWEVYAGKREVKRMITARLKQDD